ncbi:UDP-glucose--hexose-1-phosphate uridylyltransferase [Paenalkalicoccus suaedae]|uniref:Galactose-1-phosphate uridylyltransferase n=1 Tax=Paenalkalicoccus suaedae TaxID=2592382 RepID=A0A859FAX3_9BACI|nr:UDP-glucose--hexose-1-phosphate uridylyltransferase [Paenalkalicoccus suaedae]QKS70147.1 UDP-glucose--hexose-1-phosphate uridylyltransferase [Paenalkalicoccus suaedae]
MIDARLNELVSYAYVYHLIEEQDIIYTKNQLMDILGIVEAVEEPSLACTRELAEILDDILDWAHGEGLIGDTVTERDLLDTKLMGVFATRPSEVTRAFRHVAKEESIEAATAWFYEWNQDIHYIRRDRIAKNMSWKTPTEFGDIDITVNLSKPEKDPKEIQAAKLATASNYPLCLLCKENVGYAGRLNHPARQNLRTIPVTLNNEEWHLQFSPYVYYHEHAIVFKGAHEPMKITKLTFTRLLDFVEQYPHYFIGSNADLPIVGGSILSHDHYQAGKYEFPMAQAEEEESLSVGDVTISKVKWPMSVLRVKGKRKEDVVAQADRILTAWKAYSDASVDVLATSNEEPHHTITPIARYRSDQFELDLVLRNNRTSDEHPMGIFHPHSEVHHIKKENIGLIEVMGLAVLPGRLKEELQLVGAALTTDVNKLHDERIVKHKEWALDVQKRHSLTESNVESVLQQEVGFVFEAILGHAGVFKRDQAGQQAFVRFLESLK